MITSKHLTLLEIISINNNRHEHIVLSHPAIELLMLQGTLDYCISHGENENKQI
jgi:hypothetical protein